jgi:hypothetical protein
MLSGRRPNCSAFHDHQAIENRSWQGPERNLSGLPEVSGLLSEASESLIALRSDAGHSEGGNRSDGDPWVIATAAGHKASVVTANGWRKPGTARNNLRFNHNMGLSPRQYRKNRAVVFSLLKKRKNLSR